MLGVLLALTGCIENRVFQHDPVPVADPPGSTQDDLGEPPDWQECQSGWVGRYYNLPFDHPDVGPSAPPLGVVDDPAALGWWSPADHAFTRFDPSVDFGGGWWPVDEGLAQDPAFFAVSWNAWLRAWDSRGLEVLLGGADDAWLVIRGEVVAESHNAEALVVDAFDLDLDPGQYPIELYYAHRTTPSSGFRFRILSGNVSLCYPDYAPDAE